MTKPRTAEGTCARRRSRGTPQPLTHKRFVLKNTPNLSLFALSAPAVLPALPRARPSHQRLPRGGEGGEALPGATLPGAERPRPPPGPGAARGEPGGPDAGRGRGGGQAGSGRREWGGGGGCVCHRALHGRGGEGGEGKNNGPRPAGRFSSRTARSHRWGGREGGTARPSRGRRLRRRKREMGKGVGGEHARARSGGWRVTARRAPPAPPALTMVRAPPRPTPAPRATSTSCPGPRPCHVTLQPATPRLPTPAARDRSPHFAPPPPQPLPTPPCRRPPAPSPPRAGPGAGGEGGVVRRRGGGGRARMRGATGGRRLAARSCGEGRGVVADRK